MGRRSGLGRGLGAILPEAAGEPDAVPSALQDLPVGQIRPNRYQPRAVFDDDAIATLSASIEQLGVLQPILVRPTEDGSELIAGEDIYVDISSTLSFIDPNLLRRFLRKHGLDHIAFGSDYPLCSPCEELAKLDAVLPELTPRELAVLELIAQGDKNSDIAAKLVISDKTVRNHITNIFSKLQVADRAQANITERDAGLANG